MQLNAQADQFMQDSKLLRNLPESMTDGQSAYDKYMRQNGLMEEGLSTSTTKSNEGRNFVDVSNYTNPSEKRRTTDKGPKGDTSKKPEYRGTGQAKPVGTLSGTPAPAPSTSSSSKTKNVTASSRKPAPTNYNPRANMSAAEKRRDKKKRDANRAKQFDRLKKQKNSTSNAGGYKR